MFESTDVAITAVLSILIVTDIVGNSLVCFIIIRNQDMRYADIIIYKRSHIQQALVG